MKNRKTLRKYKPTLKMIKAIEAIEVWYPQRPAPPLGVVGGANAQTYIVTPTLIELKGGWGRWG